MQLKRMLASALICCLTVGSGMTAAAGAEGTGRSFADLTGHWSKAEVEYLSQKGIIDGVEKDGKLWILPDKTITRAEYIKILVGALNKKSEETQAASFRDVNASHWAFKYVETAKKEGLVDGYEDGAFKPDAEITRAELATLLVRAYKLKEKPDHQIVFEDVSSSNWAYNAIKTAASNQLVEGTAENGKTWFKPAAAATRAESMTVIARYMKQLDASSSNTNGTDEKKDSSTPAETTTPGTTGNSGSGSSGGGSSSGSSSNNGGVTIALSGADLIASVGKGKPIAGTDGQGNTVELTGLNLIGFRGGANSINVETLAQENVFKASNTVVPGIVGPVIEFSTNGIPFNSATLTFNVGSIASSKNLVAAYFNETSNKFEFLNTTIPGDGTLSFVTNHNSKYVLIDKLAWEQAWKNNLSVTSGVYKPYVDYAFIIDSSGSMSWNDPSDLRKKAVTDLVYNLNYNSSSSMVNETVTVLGNVYTNSVHSESDRAAIIDFDNWAQLYSTFSADGATVASAVYQIDSSGGTNIFSGLQLAYEQFDKNGDPNHRFVAVLLTDGQDSPGIKDWNMIQTAYGKGVMLVTMGLSQEVDKLYLEKMALLGGGQYFQVLTAEELEASFKTVVETTRHNEFVDADQDGLDDYYEVTGMLLENGMLVKTSIDPLTGKDTDNDGFTDGEEMGQPEDVVITADMVPSGSELVGKTVKMFKNVKSSPTDPNDKP
ncbi:S-layer homology domain-containing protein [Paenibacillus sp. UNC451MF]|uniref:S-layer homology domain-containing protein n=1 Tax=Paenibacillus sp. UNC451MF TaxID=1449063 RepID=UPI00048D9D18|nr:S-layer homology domain-containing protein [Paenibacillus sp. UNC451MF]